MCIRLQLEHIPNAARISRLRTFCVWATGIEALFCFASLPLGAARKGGLGIASAVVNTLFLIISAIGCYSCLTLKPAGIAFHSAIILGMLLVCIMFTLVVVAVNSAGSEGGGDDEEQTNSAADAIILIVFIFFLYDLGVACLTARFLFALHYVEKAAAGQNTAIELPPVGNPRAGDLSIGGQEAQLGDLIQVQPAIPTPVLHKQNSWNLTPAQEARVPAWFKCPITHQIMYDPVSLDDGHTYERSAIKEWLRNHNSSPITNLPLRTKKLIPNHSLRGAIEDWVVNVGI